MHYKHAKTAPTENDPKVTFGKVGESDYTGTPSKSLLIPPRTINYKMAMKTINPGSRHCA